jgi:para-aminobenzoate synthetase component I
VNPIRPISGPNELRGVEVAVVQVIQNLEQGMMLSSCGFRHDPWSQWEVLAALGAKREIVVHPDELTEDIPARVQQFLDEKDSWYFFHFNYDLKNCFEELVSLNPDRAAFPELVVFEPLALIGVQNGVLYGSGDALLIRKIERQISMAAPGSGLSFEPMQVHHAQTAEQYREAVLAVLSHIRRGDVYELNFCQEFYAGLTEKTEPATLWRMLSKSSPAPFSAFYRWKHHALISASPERFLKKCAATLISQPIKGTIRRGVDGAEDLLLKEQLLHDEKERSENVMIVDLVRNDLSRVARRGSVKVPELFGIYSFPSVHQMISTVQAEVKGDVTFMDILKALFPMGSMTGAPKIRAMELIDNYESGKRGLYSGTVGYMNPEGDFDMNVIIRSLILNLESGLATFFTGGAITAASDPMAEYQESMLKARALINLLEGKL